MTTASKAAHLRSVLKRNDIAIVPGVFDMISARLADRAGFSALYMSGYGTVASHLGLPDAGLASYTEMVDRVAHICGGTNTPFLCDADTGYGGLLNVRRTVQGYETAGAAAIQIEDQEIPKLCGHLMGRRVIAAEDMVLKVKVALEARRNPDTMIIARTDARTSLGLDAALSRGEAYAKAGADILFIESPESVEELERIGRTLSGAALLLCNVVYDGRTPEVTADELGKMGFNIALYPGLAHKAAAGAVEAAYNHLKEKHTQHNAPVPVMKSARMHELMGFPDIWDFSKRWDRNKNAGE
jgi:2,3-dimethylmalate lyase